MQRKRYFFRDNIKWSVPFSLIQNGFIIIKDLAGVAIFHKSDGVSLINDWLTVIYLIYILALFSNIKKPADWDRII